MNLLCIRSGGPLRADFELPGDRHLSRLAILLGAAAGGTSLIEGCSPFTDARETMTACRSLGAHIEVFPEERNSSAGRSSVTVLIEGRDFAFKRPAGVIDCGASWSSLCLLPALLATQPFTTRLAGGAIPPQLMRVLGAAGVSIAGSGSGDRIYYDVAGTLHPPPFSEPFSAGGQIVKESCLLLAAQAEGESCFTEVVPLRNHIEHLLSAAGAEIGGEHGVIKVRGSRGLRATRLQIPGDTDQALAWMAAAAALPGSEVIIRRAGLNPLRSAAFKVLLRMGVKVTEEITGVCAGEECGSVMVRGTALQGTVLEAGETASLRALLPVLTMAASVARGTTVLRVAPGDGPVLAQLRAVTDLLGAFGVRHRWLGDALEITGSCGAPLSTATFDCAGDTALAAGAAVGGLLSIGDTLLSNPGSLADCWPGSLGNCLPVSAISQLN